MARGGIVAILFTDVVGSTSLYDALGDEEAEKRRRRHFALVRENVAEFGGDEVKTVGDGFMVVFASAVAAVDCGIAILDAVARDRGGLDVRLGIHLGEPLEDDEDVFGLSVNVAKRLCDASGPGQLLVSDMVRALVTSRGRHSFTSVGSLSLRGVGEPLTAYEVSWERAPDEEVPLPPGLAAADRAPLVGRARELSALEDAWRTVDASGGLLVALVRGEPGIGKTRLVAAFARSVGSTALFGRCDETAAGAYHAFADALDGAVRALPVALEELRAALGSTAPHVAALGPVLADALAVGPPPAPDRRALFEGVSRFLSTVGGATTSPLLLVLDDLHWADEATLALLQHIRRALLDEPVLVVGTYRDTDVDRAHPFAATLADLRRDARVLRVDVRGLSQQDVIDLVAADDDGRVGAAIHEETEGNAFFAGEVIRHLVDVGALRTTPEGRREVVDDAAVKRIDLPEGVREVVGRRLSALGDEANRILAMASVAGRTFRVSALAALADLDPDAVLDHLDGAIAARLVAEERGAPDSFSFTHALIRQTLYEELPTLRRLRLHERLGAWLAANDAAPNDVANHLLAALPSGDPGEAARWALAAARAAGAVAGYEEGLAAIARARHALDDLGTDATDAVLRVDLDLEEAELAHRAADIDVGTDAALRAADGARRLGDSSRFARAAITMGRSGRPLAPDPRLDQLIEEALARPDLDPVDRARLLPMRQFRLGPSPGRWERSIEALEAARATGDTEALGYSLIARVDALSASPDLAEAFALVDEAADLIAVTPTVATGAPAVAMRRMVLLLRAGRRAAAEEFVGWAREHTTRLRILREIPFAFESMLAVLAGDVDTAGERAEEAMAPGWTMSALWGAATLVLARREQGRHAEAVAMLRAVTGLVAPDPLYELLADALAYEGGLGPRSSNVDDDAFWADRGAWPVEYAAMVAEGALVLGRSTLLTAAADALRPFTGQWACGPGVVLGPAEFYLGAAARLRGDAAEAVSRVESAIALAAAFPSPLWTTIGDLELAEALAVRGDHAAAVASRTRALERAEAHGLVRLERAASAKL